MSKTTTDRKRATLECGWCGDVAIYGGEDGLFAEGSGGPCITCGFPGRVEVDDTDRAYWNCPDDDEAIAKWKQEYPAAAAQMTREIGEAQERWAKENPELMARLAELDG